MNNIKPTINQRLAKELENIFKENDQQLNLLEYSDDQKYWFLASKILEKFPEFNTTLISTWQKFAFADTVQLAQERGMVGEGHMSLAHLEDMQKNLKDISEPDKVGRWLGWAQSAVVANKCATLEEFMKRNKKLKNEFL